MSRLLTAQFTLVRAIFLLVLGTEESRERLRQQGLLLAVTCISFLMVLDWLVFAVVFVDINDHPFVMLHNFLINLQLKLCSCSLHLAALCLRLFEPMLTSLFVHVRAFSCDGGPIMILPALL